MIEPATIESPVGLLDLAPTFCRIAGVDVPAWVEGRELPLVPQGTRERVITTWDSQFAAVGMHMATLHRDGLTLTLYAESTRDVGGRFPLLEWIWGDKGRIPHYDGAQGELYDESVDPLQWRNLWNDESYRRLRSDLTADLLDHAPTPRAEPLPVAAPT